MAERAQHSQAKRQSPKVTIAVTLLRYAAGILTTAAFVGGAGWLLQRRAKRRKEAQQLEDQGDE